MSDPAAATPAPNDPAALAPGAPATPAPDDPVAPASDDAATPDPADKEPLASQLGRVLVAVYGVFALAATSRAAVQIATRFDEAPLAYLLSAVAAVLYVLATIALARSGRVSRRVALAACGIEAAGVLIVGTLSVVDADAFPDETVWSWYGRGYLFIPLVLPFLGLLWLRTTNRASANTSPPPTG